jgi:hypothetical protein
MNLISLFSNKLSCDNLEENNISSQTENFTPLFREASVMKLNLLILLFLKKKSTTNFFFKIFTESR